MRHLLLTLCALTCLSLGSPAIAGEVTYRATMTGIECNDCKKKIATALGRIKGVETIRISNGPGDKHSLTVKTDGSNTISQGKASGIISRNGSHYQLVSWSKS